MSKIDLRAVMEGEASESEDESRSMQPFDKTKGIAIEGEAPESDEEVPNITLPKSSSINDNILPKPSRIVPERDSLLQKKLYESNSAVWQNMNNLLYNAVEGACKQLKNSEQFLIKSQVMLQNAAVAVKKVNGTSTEVVSKLGDILAFDFIPNIRFPE